MRTNHFLWRRILQHLCVRALAWSSCNPYSNLAYRIPSYQETAVNNFLTNHKPPFTSAQYNTSGVCTYSPNIFSSGPHINFLCSLALSRICQLTGTVSKFSLLILPCLKWPLKQVQTTSLVCSFSGPLAFGVVLTTRNRYWWRTRACFRNLLFLTRRWIDDHPY